MPQIQYTEQDVLDQGFRARIIREITGTENKRRKSEAFKAYECFKDSTSLYVLQLLLQQFDPTTVLEMQYAVTNISFARKIVDKLARVYSNGVKRSFPKKSDTKMLEEFEYELNVNQKMKQANRYLKLLRNVELYVRPILESSGKYELCIDTLLPYLYDVIEDPNNPTEGMCYILSNFRPDYTNQYSLNPATEGRTSFTNYNLSLVKSRGDGTDQIIADAPTDKQQDTFIWWTKNYHFTTDTKGVVIEGDGINPIGELPFVSLAVEQDNSYWALGGKDIIEGGIRVNALLSHINHISITQGYGQLTMTGKNLPKTVKVGPNHCIQLSQEEGEPTPSVAYLSANPPVADLMKVVEMYVALLLSTNNLSTSGFSSSLSGPNNFASGVAMMLDKAESIEDVEEQRQMFYNAEQEMWELIQKWHELYKSKGLLEDDLQSLSLPQNMELMIEFPPSQTIMTESERLDLIQKKYDLGLISDLDKIMESNPSLTEKQAQQKLLEITQEKLDKMQQAMLGLGGNQNGKEDGQKSGQANGKASQTDGQKTKEEMMQQSDMQDMPEMQ